MSSQLPAFIFGFLSRDILPAERFISTYEAETCLLCQFATSSESDIITSIP